MIDLGISKLAMIGAVALVVIGPEKLPRVARTVGTLIGKAQRYVADVKAEVSRSMELDELKKMKDTVESAANDVSHSMQTSLDDITNTWAGTPDVSAVPVYRHPKKKWRLKQGATPNWFKARTGVRTKALSGAARVARFRPTKFD
ncbi:MAG: twin arginine-targeting protein translocase TatB [Pseudomonadota bacterium]